MRRKQTAGVSGFDPDYYRRRYSDLGHLSDAQARAHFTSHGRLEGRKPNVEARFEDSELMAKIPLLFSVGEYRRLNPDVANAASDDWDVYLHYIRHGFSEGRKYTELDAQFYADIYLRGSSSSLSDIGQHFRKHEGRPGFHRSLDALIEFHGAEAKTWQTIFSDRAFSLLNFSWLGEMLEGPKAIARFLEDGVARMAEFSFDKRFDFEFYKEIHPLLADAPPERAYRHWLFEGLDRGEPGSAQEWLRVHGLQLNEFPVAFAWNEYALAHLSSASVTDRWAALKHLLDHPTISPSTWPVLDDGCERFLIAMARKRLHSGDAHLAVSCLQRAIAMGRDGPAVWQVMGEAYHALQLWGQGYDFYRRVAGSSSETLWTAVLGAECAMKAGDTGAALEMLLAGKSAYDGDQPWVSMLESVVSEHFNQASLRARTMYSASQRATADVVLEEAVEWMTAAWTRGLNTPAPLPSRKRKVVVLANKSLPQCTHYRVDQKAYLLEEAGWDYEIFEWTEVEQFLSALPDASAAIFYRVPAFPHVVKAILAAKAQDVRTYYEIDDLIFDPENYPDSFESFQGQIGRDVYQGLLYGTTLYRSAMRLCDFGIASTQTLARQIEREVISRQCFVVRNGLDPRNLGLNNPVHRARSDGRIRIVYGSATLAHNQDFHDMAGEALRHVLERWPQTELVIVGHLDLGDAFDGYRSRVKKVDLIRDPCAFWTLLSECDINLAVLAPGLMTDCKSEIKWLEAAVLGLPSIVSATATYREVIDDGVTGLLAQTPGDWKVALNRLVEDETYRCQVGQAARQRALKEYGLVAGAEAMRLALEPADVSLSSAILSARKRRILLVNVFFPPQAIGGATRVVADNFKHFRQLDEFDFAVATTDYDAKPAYRTRIEAVQGAPVFRIAPPFEERLDWKHEDPRMAEWFKTVLTQYQPDLVHFHCVQRMTASIVDVCREQGIRHIISVHDGWWLSDYQFLFDERARVRIPGDEIELGSKPSFTLADTLNRRAHLTSALHGADRILTPSNGFTEIYKDVGLERAKTLGNGLPNWSVAQRSRSASERVRLAHIGDTSPHKGFDLVESVLRQANFGNIELLALSHGRPEHEVTQEVWGATPVTLAGRVPQEQVPQLYANIDVLLAPSACLESYGLVTREANAAGVWVVASDRGAIGEDVRPGVDGFVIDVSSPAGLAEVLRMINDDPATYRQPAPRNEAIRTSTVQAEQLMALYRELLAEGKMDALSLEDV